MCLEPKAAFEPSPSHKLQKQAPSRNEGVPGVQPYQR